MQAPVVSISSKEASFINLADVTVIKWDKIIKNVVFMPPFVTYRIARSTQDMAGALEPSEFLRVDQNVIINMTRAVNYDKKKHILHFQAAGEDNMDWCYVSEANRPTVREIMKV